MEFVIKVILAFVLTTLNYDCCLTKRQIAPKKWVVDTDAGADDAVALALMLGVEDINSTIKVLAVTAVNGNTNADNVAHNVLKVLDTALRLDISVHKGSNRSLLITPPSDDFFGTDGFGDFEYPNPPSDDLIQKQHAVNYLTDIVRESPGEINILAIGPLTNIALAVRMDETFLANVGDLVILGGSVHGGGNIKPGVEFNVYVDPEAFSIVLDEAARINKTIQMVVWEAFQKVNISMEWRKNTLGAIKSPLIELLNNAERISTDNKSLWTSADAMAALWAVDRTFPSKFEDYSGQVEVCGTVGRGATILDYPGITPDFSQLRVLTPGSIDSEYVKATLMNVFTKYNPK